MGGMIGGSHVASAVDIREALRGNQFRKLVKLRSEGWEYVGTVLGHRPSEGPEEHLMVVDKESFAGGPRGRIRFVSVSGRVVFDVTRCLAGDWK